MAVHCGSFCFRQWREPQLQRLLLHWQPPKMPREAQELLS